MRAVFAMTVAALAIAMPAGAVMTPRSFSEAFSTELAQSTPRGTKSRTCQAGSRRKVILKSRHPPVVACEQPPKSNLLTPDSVAKAASAALASLG